MVKVKGQVVRRRQPRVEKIKVPRIRRARPRAFEAQQGGGRDQTPDEFFASMGLEQGKPQVKQVKKPIRIRGSRLITRTRPIAIEGQAPLRRIGDRGPSVMV